jgi:hypothetical protein
MELGIKRKLSDPSEGERQGKKKRMSPTPVGQFLLTGPSALFAFILSFISPWRPYSILLTSGPRNGYHGIALTCRALLARMMSSNPGEIGLAMPKYASDIYLDVADAEWDPRVTHLNLPSFDIPIARFYNLREIIVHSTLDGHTSFDDMKSLHRLEKLNLSIVTGKSGRVLTDIALPIGMSSVKTFVIQSMFNSVHLPSLATLFPSLRSFIVGLQTMVYVDLDKDLHVLEIDGRNARGICIKAILDKETGAARPPRVTVLRIEGEVPDGTTLSGPVDVDLLYLAATNRRDLIDIGILPREMHVLGVRWGMLPTPALWALPRRWQPEEGRSMSTSRIDLRLLDTNNKTLLRVKRLESLSCHETMSA